MFGSSSLKIPFSIRVHVWSLFCSPPLHPDGEESPDLRFENGQTRDIRHCAHGINSVLSVTYTHSPGEEDTARLWSHTEVAFGNRVNKKGLQAL